MQRSTPTHLHRSALWSSQVSGGAQALGESGNRAFVPSTDLLGPAELHHMAAIAAIATHPCARLNHDLLLGPQQTGLKGRTDATVPILKTTARHCKIISARTVFI